MAGGDGSEGTLRVDPELLSRFGEDLQTSAAGLPAAPPPFVVAGGDAISDAIAGRLPGIEGPIQDGLPQVKTAAAATAGKIVAASGQYQRTDEQFAAEYEKHRFDQSGASGQGAAGSGAGGAGGADSMSQLMSMPMQMAGQAMQMPMQVLSALSSVPQGIMQGVQQIGQMTGGMGNSDGASGTQSGSAEPGAEQPRDRQDDDHATQDPQSDAAPGEPSAERAPVTTPEPQQSSPRHAAPDPAENL